MKPAMNLKVICCIQSISNATKSLHNIDFMSIYFNQEFLTTWSLRFYGNQQYFNGVSLPNEPLLCHQQKPLKHIFDVCLFLQELLTT